MGVIGIIECVDYLRVVNRCKELKLTISEVGKVKIFLIYIYVVEFFAEFVEILSAVQDKFLIYLNSEIFLSSFIQISQK